MAALLGGSGHHTVAPKNLNIEIKKAPNFDQEVLVPLKAEQAKEEAAAEAAAEAAQAAAAEQARIEASVFHGSIGWSAPGGNCVDLANAYGKNQPGNPISWEPSTNTPFIGAAALFYFNHVAVVSGIYPDGSVEVMQLNCPGCATHFSPGEIRGYF